MSKVDIIEDVQNEEIYDPDCPICHGTGCVYGSLHDPPDECDCWDRFDPSTIIKEDEHE